MKRLPDTLRDAYRAISCVAKLGPADSYIIWPGMGVAIDSITNLSEWLYYNRLDWKEVVPAPDSHKLLHSNKSFKTCLPLCRRAKRCMQPKACRQF